MVIDNKHERGKRSTQAVTIGLDVARTLFQVHGVDLHDKAMLGND